MRKLLLAAGVLVLALVFAAPVQAASPMIQVGLWSGQANILLSAESDFSLVDAADKEVLASFKAKDKVSVSYKDGKLAVNGKPTTAREIVVEKADKADQAAVEVNKRFYRGKIALHRTAGKNGLTVVNTLPLEQYLYGIIAKEISPSWPLEAVKAQAIAARTYAIYSLGKHHDDGYDVCATTDCQVYGGRTSEEPRAIQAVDATFGLVVAYQGKPIPAYFHGSGGGYTENSENVWGTAHPALRAVADYDDKSPYYRWEKAITTKELTETLLSAGYNLGTLQTIELSILTKPPVTAPDRGVSGRVKEIRFSGSNGSFLLTGNKLRGILGLNSTLFDVKVTLPSEKSVQLEITDRYSDKDIKTVEINLPPLTERNLPTDKPNIRRVGNRPNETVVFSGFGWGHGLGLSQWGAKAMADKASPADTAYFKTILKHYYSGVEIIKWY